MPGLAECDSGGKRGTWRDGAGEGDRGAGGISEVPDCCPGPFAGVVAVLPLALVLVANTSRDLLTDCIQCSCN